MAYFELLGCCSDAQLSGSVQTGLGLQAHDVSFPLPDDLLQTLDFRISAVLLGLQGW